MPTAFDYIYAAAKEIMVEVDDAASTTVTQAPTNYGKDFRIPAGQAKQVDVAIRWQRRLLMTAQLECLQCGRRWFATIDAKTDEWSLGWRQCPNRCNAQLIKQEAKR